MNEMDCFKRAAESVEPYLVCGAFTDGTIGYDADSYGTATRKITCLMTQSLIVSGRLPFDHAYKMHGRLPLAHENDSELYLTEVMSDQIRGVMSACGWSIMEEKVHISSCPSFENIEGEEAVVNNMMDEITGFSDPIIDILYENGVFHGLYNMACTDDIDATITLYTNEQLSNALKGHAADLQSYIRFFQNMNIYNLSPICSFYANEQIYFVTAYTTVESGMGALVEINDYYMNPAIPYVAYELKQKIDRENLTE